MCVSVNVYSVFVCMCECNNLQPFHSEWCVAWLNPWPSPPAQAISWQKHRHTHMLPLYLTHSHTWTCNQYLADSIASLSHRFSHTGQKRNFISSSVIYFTQAFVRWIGLGYQAYECINKYMCNLYPDYQRESQEIHFTTMMLKGNQSSPWSISAAVAPFPLPTFMTPHNDEYAATVTATAIVRLCYCDLLQLRVCIFVPLLPEDIMFT